MLVLCIFGFDKRTVIVFLIEQMKMLSIYLFLMAALASSTSFAHPDATPTAHARTTDHRSSDTLYSYAYAVDVPEYRNFYDHEEDRSGDVTRGRFRVALPDNRLQTVVYRAGRKGYSAQISYDLHPNFESLRASVEPVGPIRVGPRIGQSVVQGSRGENWKGGPQEFSRRPLSSLEPSRPRPAPSRTNPNPTPVRRRPTESPFKPRPSTTKIPRQQRFRPTNQRPQSPASPSQSGPNAQRLSSNGFPTIPLVTTPRPQPTTRPPVRTPSPNENFPNQASLFVSTEGLEDPQILTRLIEAIRLKVEEEEAMLAALGHHDDDDSHEKDEKPRYTIKNRASVIERLNAIVHQYPLAKI